MAMQINLIVVVVVVCHCFEFATISYSGFPGSQGNYSVPKLV